MGFEWGKKKNQRVRGLVFVEINSSGCQRDPQSEGQSQAVPLTTMHLLYLHLHLLLCICRGPPLL